MRSPYDWIGRAGLVLAVAGALNWLLVGLFEWNFVSWVLTDSATQVATTGERIAYVIVGVGGVLAIPMLAATFARARRREPGQRQRPVTSEPDDDMAFYLGAPKHRSDPATHERPSGGDTRAPLRAHDSIAQAQSELSIPMRKTEPTITRAEEPVSMPADEADTTRIAVPQQEAYESLRHGRVEESDEDYEERRAA